MGSCRSPTVRDRFHSEIKLIGALGSATAQISEGPGATTPEPSGSPMPSEDYSFITA
jgi:hypothetical protein